MIQIGFEPALDSYHAFYRLVRLLPIIASAGGSPVDTVRILDFYLIFPFRLEHMRVKPEHRRLKKVARGHSDKRPYAKLPNDRELLERMWPFQMAALETAAAKELLNPEALENHRVEPTSADVSDHLVRSALQSSDSEADLMEALTLLAREYPLNGPEGLKARTGLLEHRYDPV